MIFFHLILLYLLFFKYFIFHLSLLFILFISFLKMSGGKREGKEKVLNNASFLPFFFVLYLVVLFIIFFLVCLFFSFLFSYYYFCVGPNPLLFIFERMQIGFTKKGLPAGQPRIKLHHPAMQCVSNRETHQHEQTPIIHLPPTSQSKSEIGK